VVRGIHGDGVDFFLERPAVSGMLAELRDNVSALAGPILCALVNRGVLGGYRY
jgi:hypothetical protein